MSKRIEIRWIHLVCGLALVVGATSLFGCDRKEKNEQVAESESPTETAGDEEGDREQKVRPGQADEQAESEDEATDVPESLDELPDNVNAVQHEMQLLNTAMHNTLTLIANDQLEAIPGQIKNVHPARQLTEKAIETGQYEPPVNADDMEGFAKMDEAFHKDLRGLVKAAKDDDLEEATTKYRDLVQGCTDCHTKYRFEGDR